ncbi:MAG: hypothetical protein RR614_02410 [Eubacterium sp.]
MRKLFYGLLVILVSMFLVGCSGTKELPFVGTWHEDYFNDDGTDYNQILYHNLTLNDDGTFENIDTVLSSDASNIYRSLHQSGSYGVDDGSFIFNVQGSSGGYKTKPSDPKSPFEDPRDSFGLRRFRFKRHYEIVGDTLTLYENDKQDPMTNIYFQGTYHRGYTADCPKINSK